MWRNFDGERLASGDSLDDKFYKDRLQKEISFGIKKLIIPYVG